MVDVRSDGLEVEPHDFSENYQEQVETASFRFPSSLSAHQVLCFRNFHRIF